MGTKTATAHEQAGEHGLPGELQRVARRFIATLPFELPDGVALRIAAGEPLTLNLHLFNATTSSLEGRSGVEIVSVADTDVESEADIVLAGKTEDLVVVPGVSTHVGGCTMPADTTLLALWPHMHQLGAHSKVVVERDSGDVPLLDRPYDFEEQLYDAIEPFEVLAGERLRVECTYENPGPHSVTFGDSSSDEMCFAGLVRYPRPALSVNAICTR